MPRQYDFNGLAGCVEQRKSRETGLLVGLYHAEQAGMDPAAGAWATVCEAHGHLVSHGAGPGPLSPGESVRLVRGLQRCEQRRTAGARMRPHAGSRRGLIIGEDSQ